MNHFKFLAKRTIELKIQENKDKFFNVFDSLDYSSKRVSENEQQNYRNLKNKITAPIFGWLVKFMLIVVVLASLIVLKFIFIDSQLTSIYNQYYFFKNKAWGQMYYSFNNFLISNQLSLRLNGGNSNSTNSSLILNQGLFANLTNSIFNSTNSFNLANLMITTDAFRNATNNIWYGDSCALFSNVSKYCDNNLFVKTSLKRGLTSVLPLFLMTFSRAKRIFYNTTAVTTDQADVAVLVQNLAQLSRIQFP